MQDNIPPDARVDDPRVTQVSRPHVTPIDLTVRERLQELERDNKRLKVVLEKRKEIEEAAIPRSSNERSYRHREFGNAHRWSELHDDRRRRHIQSNERRKEDVRDEYQSRDHRDDGYNGRYDINNDHYYAAERDRHEGTNHVKHRQRVDRNNDRHSKKSRREKEQNSTHHTKLARLKRRLQKQTLNSYRDRTSASFENTA
ncbi:putative uncharacterized protein DDB_G0281733 [Papaver somniferum]|uniref:putative uncharacterized protein DDB_G0281733 n=1 Tax=Papaver somniferum TaxID=3469 RepID=UPI000E6F5A20|nr:putative uncharacterized protein DDB_G0281733 [Papaver somniferum]